MLYKGNLLIYHVVKMVING